MATSRRLVPTIWRSEVTRIIGMANARANRIRISVRSNQSRMFSRRMRLE